MKKKDIKFNWIEAGTKKSRKRITITAKEEDKQLKLKTVKCLPAIVCITCIGLLCPKLTQCPSFGGPC